MNDPAQNPLYGHWDMYAVFAFVFALFAVPVLPALMGCISMWRTHMFHMRGFWLGLAAVVLNVAATVLSLWLMSRGISTQELYAWLLDNISGGSVGGNAVSV